jgi:hypothetical protein
MFYLCLTMSDDDQLGFPSHTKNENVVRDHPMIINVQIMVNHFFIFLIIIIY